MFTSALTVSVTVLPVFGIAMLGLRRYVAWTSLRMTNLVSRDAAIVYTAVLIIAVAYVAGIGRLPLAAVRQPSPLLWTICGLVLAAPLALLPYWVELGMSRLLQGRHRLPATGLEDARESVAPAGSGIARYAVIAVATALAEELLFRGAVLHEVTTVHGIALGVTAASLVFGLHHVSFGLPAVLGKAVAGACWSGLMLLSGFLLVPIAAHLLYQYLVYRRMVRTA